MGLRPAKVHEKVGRAIQPADRLSSRSSRLERRLAARIGCPTVFRPCQPGFSRPVCRVGTREGVRFHTDSCPPGGPGNTRADGPFRCRLLCDSGICCGLPSLGFTVSVSLSPLRADCAVYYAEIRDILYMNMDFRMARSEERRVGKE